MENKLTDEQIRRAEQAYLGVTNLGSVEDRLRAAAPYLQFPIAEPSEEEFKQIAKKAGLSGSWDCDRRSILAFIKLRNAALLPKPDPRTAMQMIYDRARGELEDNATPQQLRDAMKSIRETALAALEVQK